MKKMVFVFFAPLLLCACGSQSADETASRQDLKAHFAPIINGTWVETGYLEELAKTKSPKLASAKLQGLVSMEINTAEIQGDSLVVAGSWNNHEGYIYHLYFKPGQDEQSLVTANPYSDEGTDFTELSYKVKDTDTLLVMKKYSKDKELKEQRTYTKVTGPQTAESEPYGLQYMANKVLLSGKYTATDEQGKVTEVELTDDGMVKGFGKHSTYYVYTDFLGGDLTNMDEMSFDAFTKAQKPYIFEFRGDTLKLYQASENEERTLLIRGPLKHTLVKK